MKRVDRYVEEALLESTTSYFDSGTSGAIAVNGERSAVLKISAIEKLVQKVAETDDDVAYVHEGYGGQKIKLTSMGEKLLVYIWAKHEIQRYYPIHDFSPLVNVFFQATEEHAFQYYSHRNLKNFHGDLLALVDSINVAVERIRFLVRGAAFRKQLNAHRRLSNKNYKSLIAYIDAIFKDTSRVLVLRVDLGYSKLVGGGGVREQLDFEDVKLHRERLMGMLRRKLPTNTLLGHSWKLEYGLSKGYHYHCMFFLDGSRVREDIGWARMIGETWADKATHGRGVYYNCNRRKDAYRACGIGMIEHSDKDKRKNLQKAAVYLTKIEYYVRIVIDGRARTFGRGEMPKRAVKKRGRPRRSSSLGV